MALSQNEKKRLTENKKHLNPTILQPSTDEDPTAQFNPALVSQSSAKAAKNSYLVPIDQLITFRNKGHGDFSPLSDEELQALADSMTASGPYEPILVRETPEKKFEILSGEQRVRACKLKGIDSINAIIIRSCSDEEAKNIFLTENLYRRKEKISDKIYGWKEYAELHAGHFKDNFAKETMHESRANIYRYIKCADLIQDYLKLLDEGSLPIRVAYNLAFLSPAEQKIVLPYASRISTSLGQSIREYAENNELTLDWLSSLFEADQPETGNDSSALQTQEAQIPDKPKVSIPKQKSAYEKSLRNGMRKVRINVISRVPPRCYKDIDNIVAEALDLYFDKYPDIEFNDEDRKELELLQKKEDASEDLMQP